MVEESSASTQGLALRLIKEFDSIFNECAYEEASVKQVSANASLKIFQVCHQRRRRGNRV